MIPFRFLSWDRIVLFLIYSYFLGRANVSGRYDATGTQAIALQEDYLLNA